jgi:hypothetical protein
MFILINRVSYAQSKKDNQKDRNFKTEASRLSLKLMKKIGFSLEKADEISNILVGYEKEISDARKEFYKSGFTNSSKSSDSVRDRREGTTGYDQGFIYYKKLPSDLAKEYRDADRKANDDIVKKLSAKEDKKYEQVKDNWWAEVHKSVFSRNNNMSKEKNNK